MSECRRVSERLAAYVDGLLPASERDGVDRHLSACSACRRLAEDEGAGQRILRERRAQLLVEPLPPGLRARCESVALTGRGASPGLALVGRWWRMRPFAVLAAIVVMVFTASAFLSLMTQRSNALLAAQLTADHSRCFKLFAPREGVSLNASDVERMLSEQHGWNVHVPPSSPAVGLELVGARRCMYGETAIPHVMYRAHGQDMSLFVLAGETRKAADLVALDHRSSMWARDGTTFVLVLPVEDRAVADAIEYVKREAR
jgi:anti-sigma factor RsiW